MTLPRLVRVVLLLIPVLAGSACGSDSNAGGGDGKPTTAPTARGVPAPAAEAPTVTAVPVQVTSVVRRSIAQYLETNGVLEAENEVDIVARVAGPITALAAEEGMEVAEGQLLASIDDRELANQVAIATVSRDDARRAFERTKASFGEGLVSQESYDAALSRLESAQAQLEARQIQLDYTRVRAPFGGQVVTRNVKLAQHVGVGTPLFRISDFNPLLCKIDVPEKDLPRLGIGQPARIEVEPFPDVEFVARVQRIRPTVEAATGTVTVTLEVDGRRRLRPGMFASVFLQTDTHDDALVIPSNALVMDSIGDTVFVRNGDVASRREVRLGFRSDDDVEVLEGVREGEEVIVLGQDGLADGTPVAVLEEPQRTALAQAAPGTGGEPSPEMLAEIRQRMKERGLSDAEIDQRLQRMKELGGGQRPAAGAPQPAGGGIEGLSPQLLEYIRKATPEQLEQIKQRMRERGRTEEEIKQILDQIRGGG